MSQPSTRLGRRLLLAVAAATLLGLPGIVGSAPPAGAEEYAILTQDPEPCESVPVVGCVDVGDYIYGDDFTLGIEAQPDARQDEYITMTSSVCVDGGIFDGCTDVTIGWNNLTDATGSAQVQFDLTGDGISDGNSRFYSADELGDCDSEVTFTGCEISYTWLPYSFRPGQYSSQTRVCDTAGRCSGWEHWSLLGLVVDYEIGCAPGRDNDADGVPCEFDPDGDVTYYRDNGGQTLGCINATNANDSVPLTTQTLGNASVAVLNDFCKHNFLGLGIPVLAGGFTWVDADVFPSPGLSSTMVHFFFGSTAVKSGSNWYYVAGSSICLRPEPASTFGFVFGLCEYRAAFQDDGGTLAVDEFQLKYSNPGAGIDVAYGFDGNGNRLPATHIPLAGDFTITTQPAF